MPAGSVGSVYSPKRRMLKSTEVSSPREQRLLPAAVLVPRKGDVQDLSVSDGCLWKVS